MRETVHFIAVFRHIIVGDINAYLFHYRSMKPGRIPNWNVVADQGVKAWLELVELTSDGRLALPVALRKCLDWGAPTSSVQLLAVIEGVGEARLVPLAKAEADLAAVQAAIGSATDEARSALVFGAMSSYFRVSLQPDGRLRLPQVLVHLIGVREGEQLWVGALDSTITLWSAEGWRVRDATRREAMKAITAG